MLSLFTLEQQVFIGTTRMSSHSPGEQKYVCTKKERMKQISLKDRAKNCVFQARIIADSLEIKVPWTRLVGYV